MKRDKRVASALLVACATFASSAVLTGCGGDDSASTTTSSAASSSSAQGLAANDAAQRSAPASPTAFVPDASAPFATFAAGAAAASDPVEQTMQANLAADNQQIAPVMRYAPGDHASN